MSNSIRQMPRPSAQDFAKRQALSVAKACRAIESAETPPSLGDLARVAGMSRFHFHRVFKTVTGVTPKAHADAHRARRVREELARRETVTEAIYGAGFNSNGRFCAVSSKLLGMTPKAFRAGGPGTPIRFAVGVLPGLDSGGKHRRGVCAILVDDKPEELVRDLERRFPNAELIDGDERFKQMVARVVGFIEMPTLGFDLPLDARGSWWPLRSHGHTG